MRLYVFHDSAYYLSKAFLAKNDVGAVEWAKSNVRLRVEAVEGDEDKGWEIYELTGLGDLRLVCHWAEGYSLNVTLDKRDAAGQFVAQVEAKNFFKMLGSE